DLSYNPLNAEGADTYPIAAPTYLLLRTEYDDAEKGDLVKGFVKYLLTDGQKAAEDNNFAPLPKELADKALKQLDKVKTAKK
ncbi:MAG: phosphate ABC transporter substrate-binding protein PstS, partial [Stackebrandtia sp.]